MEDEERITGKDCYSLLMLLSENSLPESTPIEQKVCDKILERAELGKNKYGSTMERTDLSIEQWLTHAQEEAMDLAIYLEKIKQVLSEK